MLNFCENVGCICSSCRSNKIAPKEKILTKYDSNAHSVARTDDFCYIKDSTFLLVLQDLGILDKGQRETLEEALRLRNRCGHPTKYRPGSAKVSSFIEDILGIAF